MGMSYVEACGLRPFHVERVDVSRMICGTGDIYRVSTGPTRFQAAELENDSLERSG